MTLKSLSVTFLCAQRNILLPSNKASLLDNIRCFLYCRITRNSREPLIMQGFLLTYIYVTKKDIPQGYIFFRGAEKGICAFSGAPRPAIINCCLCLIKKTIDKHGKAKRSLSFAAPPSNSFQPRNNNKKGYTQRYILFCGAEKGI